MNPIEREFIRKTRQWIEFADDDLRLAQHALTLSTGVPYRLIAYHAQQCAEKYIKAYLVFHKVDFLFTHNIGYLIEEVARQTSWKPDFEKAKDLTPYAITARYPGLFDEVSVSEAQNAIRIAILVKDAVRNRLSEEGLDQIN
jgi:HEPN domain-containing protein